MKTENEIPRRNRLDLNEPAELAIYKAMQEVEKMPADVRLTNAGIKLQEARNLVADFIDSPDQVKQREVKKEKWLEKQMQLDKTKSREFYEDIYDQIKGDQINP